MKKSLRLLLATAILVITAVGAATPVKNSTVLGGIINCPMPTCGPSDCQLSN